MKAIWRAAVLGLAALWLAAGEAPAAEVRVMNSGGFSAAYLALAPAFETATGNKLVIIWGPSMGTAPEAIPNRLARGEAADVVIMVGSALGDLIKQGKVIADSRVDLARSPIGVAVKAGAPRPDISTVEAFKRTMLDAKSMAYSDSASGVYVSRALIEKLGIADQVRGKMRQIIAERVGNVVARGEAELGFQQMSELIPVPGIDVLGPIPAEVQSITVFSAGVPVAAAEPAAGRAFIAFLASPAAYDAIVKSGLQPIGAEAAK